MGDVSGAGGALLVQPPTSNRLALRAPHQQIKLAGVLSRLRELEGCDVAVSQCELALTGDGSCMALARGRRLFLISTASKLKRDSSGRISASSPHLDELGAVLSLMDGEEEMNGDADAGAAAGVPSITALCWLESSVRREQGDSATPSNSTFLLVGWSSGSVGCYARSGELLFTQRLHDRPVRGLRVHLHRLNRRVGADLLLVYADVVVLVEGRSLHMSLRDSSQAAAEAAAGQATSAGVAPHSLASASSVASSASLYPWSFRKWALSDQATVEDALLCDPLTASQPFDFALGAQASLIGSSSAAAAAAFPLQPSFLAVGSEPMLALYSPTDEFGSPSDASGGKRGVRSTRGTIKLVASKLSSAVFSMAKSWWNNDNSGVQPAALAALSSAGEQEEEQEAPIPEAESVAFERCIRDGSRQVLSLSQDPLPLIQALLSDSAGADHTALLDPLQNLAVLTDNYGRVLLLDCSQFVLMRIWKGYRDAQVALIRQQIPQAADVAAPSHAASIASSTISTNAATAAPSSARGASGAKKGKSKLSIVQQLDEHDESDALLHDFGSTSAPAPKSSAATSSPASLSTRLPTPTRATIAPLHLLLYAPRRGQLELWALPYGGRIGARNVGLGCVLQQATYCTNAANGSLEVSAHLIRANGDVQQVVISAPAPASASALQTEAAAAEAALRAQAAPEEPILAALESSVLAWSRSHECSGFACTAGTDTFQALLAPLQELEQCMWKHLPVSNAAAAGTAEAEAVLDEAHVARLAQLLSASAERLSTVFLQHEHAHAADAGDGSLSPMPLCPRLCEAVLGGVLQLLSATLTLATPVNARSNEQSIVIDDPIAREETTITLTSTSQPASLASGPPQSGVQICAPSAAMLQAQVLKQTANGWLQLLAAYHISCAPSGSSAAVLSSAAASGAQLPPMSLLRFLDCFRTQVEEVAIIGSEGSADTTSTQGSRSRRGSGSAITLRSHARTSTPPSADASPAQPLRRFLRFVLNPAVAAPLSDASFALPASSPLLCLSQLLFGPTKDSAFTYDDFIAARTVDLMLHMDQAPCDRQQLLQLFCAAWFTQLSSKTLDALFKPDECEQAREQLQMLVQMFAQPAASAADPVVTSIEPAARHAVQLAPVRAFLTTVLRWCFDSHALGHVSALLRFARSWVILPQLTQQRELARLHADRTRDGDLEMDAEQGGALGTSLADAVELLSLLDASTRVLFRHTCQLQQLRSNFPLSSVPPQGVLTLHHFAQSHPLSRLVAMHLLKPGSGGGGSSHGLGASSSPSSHGDDALSKEDVNGKLRSFESVLASGGDADSSGGDSAASVGKPETSSHLTVSSLLALRAPRDDPSFAAVRAQTVSLPLPEWDWKLTSDEASCYIFAAIHSVQLFFQSALPPAPSAAHSNSYALTGTGTAGVTSGAGGAAHHLLAAVSYLEYSPHSAASGGLAVTLWQHLLAPHIRALVHAAYPDGPNAHAAATVAPPPTSASAANLTAANAAAAATAAAKSKKAAPVTFLKLIKELHSSACASSASPSHSPLLLDFSSLESVRCLLLSSQRVLSYLSLCFEREAKDEAWEGGAHYLCPAIAQTIDPRATAHAIPIRIEDDVPSKDTGTGKVAKGSKEAAVASAATAPVVEKSRIPELDGILLAPGPPPPSSAPNLCTSLFHTHVRYVHAEAKGDNSAFANLPSPLYSRLCRCYADTKLDEGLAETLRLLEVLSAHVELDVAVSVLASSNCSVGSMFPQHPLVQEAQALKSFKPKLATVFPRLSEQALQTHAHAQPGLDAVQWIVNEAPWIVVPPTPSAPAPSSGGSSSGSSRNAPAPLTLIALKPTPIPSARLTFLTTLLSNRAALTTAPIVFSLASHLRLDAATHEALLREHIVQLYERGEDSRAWECVPRLDDGVPLATAMIALGRTRLGLFLHALESKHQAKYAQLVSAVPAQAWSWLSKAKPPHVLTRTRIGDSSAPYVLSGAPAPQGHAPLFLLLTRTITIRQKGADIDIHATFTLLKRARAILEHAVLAGAGLATGAHAGAGAATAAAASAAASLAVQGAQFGSDGDNSEQQRAQQPVRYARAYVVQLCEVCSLVLKGIAGRV